MVNTSYQICYNLLKKIFVNSIKRSRNTPRHSLKTTTSHTEKNTPVIYIVMSLFDEINKRTQLPKPRTPGQFESIETSSDDEVNSPVILNRICKPRNPNLYNPDPEEFIGNHDDTNHCPNEFEIASSILEINGGDCHSNKAIEQRWKMRVNQKQFQQENDEKKIVKKNVPFEKPKKDLQNFQYKNNALMRNLIEQKMAELEVSTVVSSSSEGGKIIENDIPINGAMLTTNPDDPDFFFLRDTHNKSEIFDDGFRFEHRGVKKTVTPRQYSIYEIDDDDFVFIKTS